MHSKYNIIKVVYVSMFLLKIKLSYYSSFKHIIESAKLLISFFVDVKQTTKNKTQNVIENTTMAYKVLK